MICTKMYILVHKRCSYLSKGEDRVAMRTKWAFVTIGEGLIFLTFHVHFFLSLIAMQREEETYQRRRETRNCLPRALRALIEWMFVGRADTLTKPIVDFVNTASVKIRTTVELCIYLIHLPLPSLTEWAINVGETVSRRVLSERSEFTRLRSNRTFD